MSRRPWDLYIYGACLLAITVIIAGGVIASVIA